MDSGIALMFIRCDQKKRNHKSLKDVAILRIHNINRGWLLCSHDQAEFSVRHCELPHMSP